MRHAALRWRLGRDRHQWALLQEAVCPAIQQQAALEEHDQGGSQSQDQRDQHRQEVSKPQATWSYERRRSGEHKQGIKGHMGQKETENEMSVTVACLMPTIKSHTQFRPTAERCFGGQVYPDNWQVELLVDEHEIDSLGTKLNRLCAACVVKGIDYVVLWDGDDWYCKDRIRRQVTPLLIPYDLV
jgi:hypothetical protein